MEGSTLGGFIRRMMEPQIETPESILKWAEDTFGPKTNLFIAQRANDEMRELLDCLESDDDNPEAPEEAADVIIVLSQLFAKRGVNLWQEVERKMAINRARQWGPDCQHIE